MSSETTNDDAIQHSSSGAGDGPRTAVVITTSGMSAEEKLSALAFQGLANRSGTNVFCRAGFWNWPPADRFWLEYFTERKGFGFVEADGLPDLVRRFPDAADGLVVWDPRLVQTRWAAVVLAGLERLVPVAPECVGRYPGLTVKEDLRGRFSSEIEAVRWAVEELLPRTSRELVTSVENAWSGPTVDSLDYAVARRSFVYSLPHKGGRDTEELKLVHRILTHPVPGSPVFGWAEPEEEYCSAVSVHDHYVMCAEAPNLSFWAQVPCGRTSWNAPAGNAAQARRAAETPAEPEDRHYIAFCMSEGDSPKMAVSVQGGAWLDPARGTIPINWGMNPVFLEFFPALLEFYWDTATDADYFTGGASGAGYTLPNRISNPDAWMKKTGELFAKTGLTTTEAWMHFSRPVYERFAELSGLEAFTMPCGPFGATLLGDRGSVAFFRGNSGMNYFSSSATPEEFANKIREHCQTRAKPSFTAPLIVPDERTGSTSTGGWSPALLLETARLLGDEYRIVTVGELARLAKRAIETGRTPDCFSHDYSEWASGARKGS